MTPAPMWDWMKIVASSTSQQPESFNILCCYHPSLSLSLVKLKQWLKYCRLFTHGGLLPRLPASASGPASWQSSLAFVWAQPPSPAGSYPCPFPPALVPFCSDDTCIVTVMLSATETNCNISAECVANLTRTKITKLNAWSEKWSLICKTYCDRVSREECEMCVCMLRVHFKWY